MINILHHTDGEYVPVEEATLKRLPSVKRCVLETIRLRAPGMITRKVVRTHTINVRLIFGGFILELIPPSTHTHTHTHSSGSNYTSWSPPHVVTLLESQK